MESHARDRSIAIETSRRADRTAAGERIGTVSNKIETAVEDVPSLGYGIA